MDRNGWNLRYAGREAEPNTEPAALFAAEVKQIPPDGRALDLACGEGRNAVWLAQRGWAVTAVDYSSVALEHARRLAERRMVAVNWIDADVTAFHLLPETFRLISITYLHLPRQEQRLVLRRAATALAPGGLLVMVGHALRNLTEGSGGPQEPRVLWQAGTLEKDVARLGLRLRHAREITRKNKELPTPRQAIDVVLVAEKP